MAVLYLFSSRPSLKSGTPTAIKLLPLKLAANGLSCQVLFCYLQDCGFDRYRFTNTVDQ